MCTFQNFWITLLACSGNPTCRRARAQHGNSFFRGDFGAVRTEKLKTKSFDSWSSIPRATTNIRGIRMNQMRIHSLIAGMASVLALTSGLASAQVRQDGLGAGMGAMLTAAAPAAAVDMKQLRAELSARLGQTNVLKRGIANDRAVSGVVDGLSDAQVMNAMSMPTHAELEASIFGSQGARDQLDALVAQGVSVAGIRKALGDANADLTYTPLNPCRIMDTRISGFPLAANVQRGFDVRSAASIAAQGGVASGGCGVIVGSRAVSVNITAISGSGGFLYAWPWPNLIPNASILNWTSSSNPVANSTILTVDYSDGPAAYLQTPVGGTDIIMDVGGYFAAPSTTLVCVTTTVATLNFVAGQNIDLNAPACAAGYTKVSTSCRTGAYNAGVYATTSGNFTGGADCQMATTTTSSMNAAARCCKL